MKSFITIILLLSTLTYNAQDFGTLYTSGVWTKQDVEKDIDKQIAKLNRNKNLTSTLKTNNGDTLSYFIQDSINGFTLKTTFNIKNSDELYCDFQEFTFDCTPCSQKALKCFLTGYGFRLEQNNDYISKYFMKTKMTIIYKSGNKNCMTISFRHFPMPKKEHKGLYKKLPKTSA